MNGSPAGEPFSFTMSHEFAMVSCMHCGEYYCSFCKKTCPSCGQDGVAEGEFKARLERWHAMEDEPKEADAHRDA